MNINASFKITINSGAALILFIAAFFLLIGAVAAFPPVEKNVLALGGILVGAFGGYLRKRADNNAKNLEAEKLKLPGVGAGGRSRKTPGWRRGSAGAEERNWSGGRR